LESSIFLEYYPKTIIDIFIQVLCADGGTRCAAVTAASLALADAGISLRDLVCGVAVGKIANPDPPTLVLDLSDVEDKEGLGDLPVAMMPRSKAYTLLQFDGQITFDEMRKALEIAENGIEKISRIQIQTIKERYSQIDKENETKGLAEEGI
jgi:exosome complex component RRP41